VIKMITGHEAMVDMVFQSDFYKQVNKLEMKV